jgi:hypothetical protein
MSLTISSVAGENKNIALKRDQFAHLIKDSMHKCQSKIKFRESRSKNLRRASAMAALKARYLLANKHKLIDQMLAADLPIKKYKVHHFLNAEFFSYYASNPNLHEAVIEAKLTEQ